jgi:type II secretory pathway component PulJ
MNCSGSSKSHAFTLVELMVYLGVLASVLLIAYTTLDKLWTASAKVRLQADDLRAVLAAGELWRRDIRSEGARVEVESEGGEQVVKILGPGTNEVLWAYQGGAILRRSGTSNSWTQLVRRVRHSSMASDPRDEIPAWRWDLELDPASKQTRFQRLYSFVSVARENRGVK